MLDLNLLRVFDVMLEERNVTRAGARLGLSQSAVSHALNRLRYALNDELFVRGPSGMHPTARAMEMGPQVHAALMQLQTAVAPGDFTPGASERRFVLAAGTFSCAVLTPPLVAGLAAAAPLAELAIEPYTAEVFDRLDAHRIDFIVGGVLTAPARFAHEVIIRETMAWVVRVDHPLARLERVELDDLVAYPHVVIAAGRQGFEEVAERRGIVTRSNWEEAGAFETALTVQGLTRRIGVSVPIWVPQPDSPALAASTRSRSRSIGFSARSPKWCMVNEAARSLSPSSMAWAMARWSSSARCRISAS